MNHGTIGMKLDTASRSRRVEPHPIHACRLTVQSTPQASAIQWQQQQQEGLG